MTLCQYSVTVLCVWSVCLYSQVTINEVMFDPVNSDENDEYVEILNLNNVFGLSLEGWKIGISAGEDCIMDAGMGLWLAPGQYAVIFDGDYLLSEKVYSNLIPHEALILHIEGRAFGKRGLSNSKNETVILEDDSDIIQSQYTYSIGNPSGYSDEKVIAEGENDQRNWMDSRQPGGTPGKKNSVFKESGSGGLKVVFCPRYFTPDGDGIDDEIICRFSLPYAAARLRIHIYSLSGRLLLALTNGVKTGSQGESRWDGRDKYGDILPSGVYIFYLEALSEVSGSSQTYKNAVIIQ